MIPDSILSALQCSLADDKHIIRSPVNIQCGHAACKTCIYKNTNQIVDCKKCGAYSEIDLDCMADSFQIKCTLKTYIEDLFKIMRDQMSVSLMLLKNELISFECQLDEHIEFLQDEIELKITSIKIELDEMCQSFKAELNDVKKKLKQYYELSYNIQEIEFEKLKNKIERNKDLNEKSFYDYELKIENLNKIFDEMKTIETKLTFEESDWKVNRSLIGTLNYNFLKQTHRNISDRLQIARPYQIFIGQAPCTLLTLSSEFLLIVFNNKLELYNNNLELIDYTYQLCTNGDLLNCCAASTNNYDKIYLCSYNSHSILVLDYRLRPVHTKHVVHDTKLYLKHPGDIYFYKGHLYVVDMGSRIVRLAGNNLEFEAEYQIETSARQLKIANDIACVNTIDFDLILFYDITSFHLLRKYDRRHGPICELNGVIYEFDKNGNKIFCYNTDGSFCMELKTRFNVPTLFDNSLGAVYHDGKIIISTSCGKLLFL